MASITVARFHIGVAVAAFDYRRRATESAS